MSSYRQSTVEEDYQNDNTNNFKNEHRRCTSYSIGFTELLLIVVVIILAIMVYRYWVYGYVWSAPKQQQPTPTSNYSYVHRVQRPRQQLQQQAVQQPSLIIPTQGPGYTKLGDNNSANQQLLNNYREEPLYAAYTSCE